MLVVAKLTVPRTSASAKANVTSGNCNRRRAAWRKSILIEYWAEQALPGLVAMTYKAICTNRYKYIHWVNRGGAGELDELYGLERDPYELTYLSQSRRAAPVRDKLRRELKRLVPEAIAS